MAIVISKTDDAPMVYGTTATQTTANIAFGIGTLDKVLEKIGATDDNNVYFGYNADSSQAAIVARGKLVSSKIVDIINTPEVAEVLYTKDDTLPEGKSVGDVKTAAVGPKITVKYINGANGSIESLDIDITSKAYVDETVAAAKTALIGGATTDGNTLKKVEDRIKTVEDLITTDNDAVIDKVSEIINWFNDLPTNSSTATDLIATAHANQTAIGVNGSGDTASTGLYKLIEDVSVANASAIEALDASATTASVANGIVTLTSKITETDGKIAKDGTDITLAKVATTGAAADVSVAAIEKTQVNSDVSVKVAAGSTVDSALSTLADVIVENASAIGKANTAASGETSNATGLYKLIELTVNGLNVASNTVDGTNVHVKYKEENGLVTVESVSEDYATVSRTETDSTETTPTTKAALTITNDGSLITGKDISTLSLYAADLVKQEADARKKAIADLDVLATASDASAKGTNVKVTVSETDGKVKVESVSEDYATITRKETSSSSTALKTDAALTVTSGDESKLVKASDIANVAAYAVDLVKQEADAREAADASLLASLDASVSDSSTYTNIEIVEENGKLKSVNASVNIVKLSSAVGMTLATEGDNAGKWVAADGSITTDGLASAADVASEIAADEKVIAAALNDHESRIDALEADSSTLDISANISHTSAKYEKTIAKTTNASIDGFSVDYSDALSTYQLHVQLGDKAAKDVTETITVVNASVIDQLLQLIQTERERAAAAEAALNASVLDHQTRLQWIELS